MIAVWMLGLTLSFLPERMPGITAGFTRSSRWLSLMSGVHGLFARWVQDVRERRNTRPARFYRLWNEVPTVLMIAIVILVVVKPF